MPDRLRPWFYGAAALAVLYVMLDVPGRIHGTAFVVWVAGVSVYTTGMGALVLIGRAADRWMMSRRKRRE